MSHGPPSGPVRRLGRRTITNGGEALLPKRTYQPKKRRRQRRHGFMHRNNTRGGRAVLKRRILKGRWRIAV
jgi:large subunit ribosomal protein L34